MDPKGKGLATPNDTLTSLEEIYTDFDQWVEKLKRFIAKRYQELNRDPSPSERIETLHLQELLVHGIFVKKAPMRRADILENIDSLVSNDHVILAIINRKYMSKL